jgi:hypothetical protein
MGILPSVSDGASSRAWRHLLMCGLLAALVARDHPLKLGKDHFVIRVVAVTGFSHA